ncbi:MAG: PDZ domain-containing protein [Phycisphaerales bacterium]|nr:MAG: PDZ domain-containing protein [Phycisphaerales bacterium]
MAAGVWLAPAVAAVAGPQDAARPQPAASDAAADEDASVHGHEFDAAVSDAVQARIDAAVQALGSPDYAERESATQILQRTGTVAFRALRDAYHLSDDLEVRLRIEAIVHFCYLDEYLTGRNGFLGISIGNAVTHADDPRVPEAGIGVAIANVLPDSAASDAGLFLGDIIIGVDHEPIRAGMAWFRDTIRQRHRGEVVVVSVIRRERVYDIEVVLGGRPVDSFDGDLAALRADVERRFRIWWGRYFMEQEASTGPESTSQGGSGP